jgi:acetophenone carboxylase
VIRDSNVRQLLAASSPELPLSVRDLLEKRTLGGRYEFLPPQAVRETYGPDDVIVLARGSGGGYGDPLEREPDAVARDVTEDLIDVPVARDIYGVILAEDGGPDEEATAARRAEIRVARLARGRPWAEFMADWSRKRPPEEALRYYGRYPIPESADDWPDGAGEAAGSAVLPTGGVEPPADAESDV